MRQDVPHKDGLILVEGFGDETIAARNMEHRIDRVSHRNTVRVGIRLPHLSGTPSPLCFLSASSNFFRVILCIGPTHMNFAKCEVAVKRVKTRQPHITNSAQKFVRVSGWCSLILWRRHPRGQGWEVRFV